MEENINEKFGKRLFELRNKLKISQEELSLRCELSRTYISNIEKGIKSPTLKVIEKISKGLQTSIDELLKF